MAFKFSSQARIVDDQGCPTPEFLRALNSLLARVGGGSKVGPSAPTGLTYSIEAGGVRLQCDANPAAEEVTAYVWRVGATWADSLLLVNFSSNNELIPSDQVGTYTIWVAAADVRGNFSTPSSMEVVVTDADLGLYGPKVTLTSTGLAFANGSPASIDITALLLNLPTPTFVWTVDGVVDAAATNGTITVNAFTGDPKVYRCTVTSGVSGLSAYGETTIYSVADGAAGARGSLKGYGTQYSISVSSWSDAKANRVISNMLTGATGTTDLATTDHLRIGDTVQLTNSSSYVESKFWSGSAWIAAATVIEGNVLVNGQGVFTGDITGASNLNITGQGKFDGAVSNGVALTSIDANASRNAIIGIYAMSGTTIASSAIRGMTDSRVGVLGWATGSGVGGNFQADGATGTAVSASAGGASGVAGSFSGTGKSIQLYGPMTIDNTTLVANLNADLLDGNHASAFATAASVQKAMIYQTANSTARSPTGQYVQLQTLDGTVSGWLALYA